MAKNTVKKKLRIAHNKTCDEDHEMISEGNDLLYDIFQEMEKNNDLSAIHLSNFEANLSETNKTFTQQKVQNNKILIPSQNHVSKSKAFGLSRKFPLMEKCTRDLNRIKHNRQMPKPRAHLAGLSNSPKPRAHLIGSLNSPKPKAHLVRMSNSPTFNNNLVSDVKSKKTNLVGKDKKNNSNSQNKKITEVLEHKVPAYETKMKKNVVKQPKENEEIPSKNVKSAIKKKNSAEENSHIICNNLDQTGVNSSDSDEYENFIKKVCPKKSKNKKSSKKPQKSTKVIKKHISKPISSESDSDMSNDDEAPSSNTSNKNCKKLKNSEVRIDNRPSTTSKGGDVSKSKKVRKKHNSRTVSQSVSSENDSDVNDKLSYATRSKRIKRSHELLDKRQSVSKDDNDSESEMDVMNDETYHDSSSESGDLPSLSEIVHDLQSNSKTCDSQSSEQSSMHIPVLECNSSHNSSGNSSLVVNNKLNEVISHKTLDTTSVISSSLCVSNKTSGITSLSANEFKLDTASSVGSDQQSICYKTLVPPSLVSSAQTNASCKTSGTASLVVNNDQPNVLHKMSNIQSSNKVNTECLVAKDSSALNGNFSKSTVVDLTESDNECENSFTVMPKIIMTSGQIPNDSQLPSEESDIELVDVIVYDPPEKGKTNCSDKNVRSDCSNDSTIKLTVKTEKIDQKHSCINAKPQNTPELQTSLNDKYEIAYTTGICHDYDKKTESKNKIINKLNLNNDKPESSIVSKADNSLISKVVKKEPPDDCEIVFDIASSKSNQNLSGLQICNNKNIKTERDSKAVKKVIPVGVTKSDSLTKEQTNKNSIVSNIKSEPITKEKANNSIVSNIENSPILSNLKKEPCDDDCEIILDIASSSTPNQNLPGIQICNTNVKIERDSKIIKQVAPVHIASGGSIITEWKNKLSQKEQILHEVACSNFRSLNNSHNKNSELLGKEIDQDAINIKALLLDLKKEFSTYQDILKTEQSVENAFKFLERSQAEKVMSLKSIITQCIESTSSSSDCNSIKNAVNKLLDSSEVSSSSSLKDCSKVPPMCHMSDISVEDLKTFATMNLVPLSSISENDIKPDLSKLQCALKQEPSSTSCEINSMSFGEKCVVCAKDASAACQQCAKVFFCSNTCGMKYWEDGHKNACCVK